MLRRAKRLVLLLVSGLLAAGLGGCSPAGPKLVSVQGKVTYRQKPVKGVSVTFIPDESKGTKGPAAAGETDDEGNFTLKTSPYGTGAIVGNFRVTINATPASGTVPAKYADFGTTPIKIDVPDDGRPNLVFKLEE